MGEGQDGGARARALAALFTIDPLPGAPGEDDAKRTLLLPVRAAAGSDDTLDETPPELHQTLRHDDPLVGGSLGGLRVVGVLGRGGAAHVYLAKDLVTGRDFAVKVLRDELARSPEARRRLAREVELLAKIDHPNIVRVFGSGEAPDGRPYIVMERLTGPSLRAVLERGALTPERAHAIALDVAAGLAIAHDAGVLHRDLKPGNVMLARSGPEPEAREVAKLVDFGCARLLDAGPGESLLTDPGGFLGTPAFAAPEQVSSPSAVDARADLYALGGLVYAMISGAPPFSGAPLDVLARKQRERPPPPPEAEGLGSLAIALLAPRPADRPSHARDVIRQLELLDVAASRTELVVPEGLALELARGAAPRPAVSAPSAAEASDPAALAEVADTLRPDADVARTAIAALPTRVAPRAPRDPAEGRAPTSSAAGVWLLAALLLAASVVALAAVALFGR